MDKPHKTEEEEGKRAMNNINLPHSIPCIKIPDEIWFNIVRLKRYSTGFLSAVRLINGTILEDMITCNRGYILGRFAEGLAGGHGHIVNSMLTFKTEDISAIRVPAFHFWQSRKWIKLEGITT
ncbi:MAG: hypothetical protein LBK60_01865 [Verrucomicrobiales bacterium]|jgi:hypothetical protein|nr:hypothetical protein [Verrucomicrobiales bacterium]